MRKYFKAMSPRQLNEMMKTNVGENIYHGEWMPQMDRCWETDDGYSIMSRLLQTEYGKVEHVTISKINKEPNKINDVPWKIKQEIKDDLFGKNRMAIEIFPTEKTLVDVCDVYHLWVFDKGFNFSFGIHPSQFKGYKYINRGFSFTPQDYEEYRKFKEGK